MRASRQSFDLESSHRDETSDDYYTEGVSLQRQGKPKRRQIHHPSRDTFQSPSPFHEGEDGIETNTPGPSQSSEKESDSQLPRSEGSDSASEVDWESLLCEDIEMLPPSNWEADFLVHQAQIMARSDYRGLRYDDLNQSNGDDDSGDEPWHPYDSESMLVDGQTELHIDSANEEPEGEKIVCYGVVSVLANFSYKFILYKLRYKT